MRSPVPAFAVPLWATFFLRASLGAWLLCAPGRARAADPLATAREQASRLDYPAALASARRALEAGEALPPEALALYAFIGQASAAVGEEAAAVAAYGTVLLLAPDFALSSSTSPKLQGALERARLQLQGRRLSARASSSVAQGTTVQTRVEVEGDALEVVAGTRLYVSREGRFQPVEPPSPWTCPASPCAHFVALNDRYGNELLRLGSPYAPLTVAGVAPPPRARAPLVRPGTLLAAAAVVAAGCAGVFGARFGAADRRLAEVVQRPATARYADAQALDADRRTSHAAMWIGAGVAVVSGGAAVLTW